MRTVERIQDKALIGSEWVPAVSGRTIEVRNPSTDELIATVPNGGAADVAKAIDAASAALPAWRALPGSERAKKLRTLYDLMIRDQDLATFPPKNLKAKPTRPRRDRVAVWNAW